MERQLLTTQKRVFFPETSMTKNKLPTTQSQPRPPYERDGCVRVPRAGDSKAKSPTVIFPPENDSEYLINRNKTGPTSIPQFPADNSNDLTPEQPIKEKLKRYDSAKNHTTKVASYITDHTPEFHKYTKKLFDCGSWLVFRNYYTVEKNRLIKANLCKKHLLCGLCAMRRSALQVKAFEPKFETVLKENPHLTPVLITFTIKDGEDLQERFNHLSDAKKKIIRRRADAINGKKTDTILKHVAGGSGSFEIIRGKNSKKWHPHIHMIAFLDWKEEDFKTFQKGAIKDGNKLKRTISAPVEFESILRQEWKQQTGDSFMVDVRRIETEDKDDKFGAICESFKYALKLNDLEISDQVEAAKVVQGKRLQFSFGNLRNVKINEQLVDDPEKELDLLPYIDLVYKHNSKQGYYLEETTDYGHYKKTKKQKTKSVAKKLSKNAKEDQWKSKVNIWFEDKIYENRIKYTNST